MWIGAYGNRYPNPAMTTMAIAIAANGLVPRPYADAAGKERERARENDRKRHTVRKGREAMNL